jgi:hypothetical protein
MAKLTLLLTTLIATAFAAKVGKCPGVERRVTRAHQEDAATTYERHVLGNVQISLTVS